MEYTIRHLKVTVPDQITGSATILKDITVEIKDNEIIGLLGPSGAGKTQLSFAFAKLNTYYGGSIQSKEQTYKTSNRDYDLNDEDELEKFRSKEIGYIFQEAFSYFNPVQKIKSQLDVVDKVKLTELKNLFEETGLEDQERIMNSYPHQLSGGQLQRLMIIQCLIRDPQLIIADEIDSALDETNALLVMDLILKLKSTRNFALLWISHDQIKAKRLCSRIWYLENGNLKYDGPADRFDPVQFDYPSIKSHHSGLELIRLERIRKSFTAFGVIKNILLDESITIHQGEIIGIIGPSGGGKSTLAKIIAGFIHPDSGNIFIDGKIISPERIPNKRIIYLFQDVYSSLNPQLSVEDILSEALDAGGNKYSLAVLLKMGELDDNVMNNKPSELSGGMRQRVAVLRAIAIRPGLLILDESLNALDHELQIRILKMLLDQIVETKMSLLIISHQEDLVRAVSDKIYKIQSGKMSLQKFNVGSNKSI
ncbi:MAG: ATP-binding cassette domain-containing protein [Saprospiraceae bacterium]